LHSKSPYLAIRSSKGEYNSNVLAWDIVVFDYYLDLV
jgi:hypothetical protein